MASHILSELPIHVDEQYIPGRRQPHRSLDRTRIKHQAIWRLRRASSTLVSDADASLINEAVVRAIPERYSSKLLRIVVSVAAAGRQRQA